MLHTRRTPGIEPDPPGTQPDPTMDDAAVKGRNKNLLGGRAPVVNREPCKGGFLVNPPNYERSMWDCWLAGPANAGPGVNKHLGQVNRSLTRKIYKEEPDPPGT